jgi:hypothetical protein
MTTELLNDALDRIQSHPLPLELALALVAAGAAAPSQDELAAAVPHQSRTREAFRRSLVAWDAAVPEINKWTEGTPVNSQERRRRIYEALQISAKLIETLNEYCPPYLNAEQTVVIAKNRAEWYTPERRQSHRFYWSQYKAYLQRRGFEPAALQQVDDDTTNIVSRLSDPCAHEPYPSRGLVIGYVQSGKTTNFTGLIAKAIDAGYRLVIVLAGTLDVLRNQTQRRLDMELVGKENILETLADGIHDYSDDRDWNSKFVSYGASPANLGGSPIDRLTRNGYDYHRLEAGISALWQTPANPSLKLFEPENVYNARTKIVVCKKNGPVLRSLKDDLTNLRLKLVDVPTLIIDDESDQASVNTKRPTPAQEVARTAINMEIVNILGLLPRSQYVGYTATPVANVFVDPDDVADLFPRDFVISLKEPNSYFGASSFHDIDPIPEDHIGDVGRSRDAAFVRDIRSAVLSDDSDLRTALDLFVLTGAIKLFRARNGVAGDFKHHTMLIHLSHLQVEHQALLERVKRIWAEGQYETGGAYPRLAGLLDTDVRPVTAAREHHLPLPQTFSELLPDLREALSKFSSDGVVSMINGHEDADTLDFDRGEVWKVIIGGTKLSRGYTVEGLTISYFRRTAGAQDSLLQMGRWFGYRQGYRDLPRLFIGREEVVRKKKNGKNEVMDLLEAFKGVCRSERALRADLAKYNLKFPGVPSYTPRDIPPMVEVHFPLAITARNKMFNARLMSENCGLKWIQPVLFSANDAENAQNTLALAQLLQGSAAVDSQFRGDHSPFDAHTTMVSHAKLLQFAQDFIWADDKYFKPKRAFLEGMHGAHGIQDWLIVLPKTVRAPRTQQVGDIQVSVIDRSRKGDAARLDSLAGSNHRAGVRGINSVEPIVDIDCAAREFRSLTRGVALIFLVRDPDNPDATAAPAFELLPPGNDLPTALRLTAWRESDVHAVERDERVR